MTADNTATCEIAGGHRPPLQLYFRQKACAIANAFLRNPGLLQNGHQQIRHGRVLRILEVTTTLHSARCATSHKDRQWRVIMNVAVAHRATVKDQRMIEQTAVAVRRVLQTLQQVGQESDVVRIDPGQSFQPARIVLMMRRGMESLGNADLRESTVADLSS